MIHEKVRSFPYLFTASDQKRIKIYFDYVGSNGVPNSDVASLFKSESLGHPLPEKWVLFQK